MNIGLLAVDSNYPNLALMKISAWHKARGDNVEWYNRSIATTKCIWLRCFLLQKIICNTSPMPIAWRKVARDMTSERYCPWRLTGCNPTIPSIRRLTARQPTVSSHVVAQTGASGVWFPRKKVRLPHTWISKR